MKPDDIFPILVLSAKNINRALCYAIDKIVGRMKCRGFAIYSIEMVPPPRSLVFDIEFPAARINSKNESAPRSNDRWRLFQRACLLSTSFYTSVDYYHVTGNVIFNVAGSTDVARSCLL